MTAQEFRDLALGLPAVTESAHMGHPYLRVRGKIFATFGPYEAWGMAKLTSDQQALFVGTEPAVFQPVQGAWGYRGYTYVRLEPAVREALIAAWRNAASTRLAQQLGSE